MKRRETFWPDPLGYTYERLIEVDSDLTQALAARSSKALIMSAQDKVRKLLDLLRPAIGNGE